MTALSVTSLSTVASITHRPRYSWENLPVLHRTCGVSGSFCTVVWTGNCPFGSIAGKTNVLLIVALRCLPPPPRATQARFFDSNWNEKSAGPIASLVLPRGGKQIIVGQGSREGQNSSFPLCSIALRPFAWPARKPFTIPGYYRWPTVRRLRHCHPPVVRVLWYHPRCQSCHRWHLQIITTTIQSTLPWVSLGQRWAKMIILIVIVIVIIKKKMLANWLSVDRSRRGQSPLCIIFFSDVSKLATATTIVYAIKDRALYMYCVIIIY